MNKVHQVSVEDHREPQIAFYDLDVDRAALDPYEFRIYLRLVRRCAGRKAGRSYESAQHMAEGCKMSRRKVFDAINGLLTKGMISRISRQGMITHYALTDKRDWKIEPVQEVHTSTDDPCAAETGTRAPEERASAPRAHMKKTPIHTKRSKEVCVVNSAVSPKQPSPTPTHTPGKSLEKKEESDAIRKELADHEKTPLVLSACNLGELETVSNRKLPGVRKAVLAVARLKVGADDLAAFVAAKHAKGKTVWPEMIADDLGEFLAQYEQARPKPAAPTCCGSCTQGYRHLPDRQVTPCACNKKEYKPLSDPLGQTEQAQDYLNFVKRGQGQRQKKDESLWS